MDSSIPSSEEVRQQLAELNNSQLDALEHLSGISIHTLIKLRNGQSEHPRLETVRAFWTHIERVKATPHGRERRDPSRAAEFVAPKRRSTDKPNAANKER